MYDVRELDLSTEGIGKVDALLREVFPDAAHLRHDYLSWQYVGNPAGKAVGFNAWAGDELAAHYVTIPLNAVVNGEPQKGLLSLNTATHPNHQGKKLFTTLADATYRRGAELGYSFVVGVANANSTPGFTKKLGFTLVRPLEARLGVGPLRRSPEQAGSFRSAWSDAALQWRLRNPRRRYTRVLRDGRARIEAATGRYGISAILGEFDAAVVDPVGLETTGAMNPLRLWLGLDPAADLKRSAYFALPEKLRTSPLNLIFLDLTGRGQTIDPAATRYDAIDFDPY